MKPIKTHSLLLVLALGCAGAASAADLVVNGSFESPAVALAPGRTPAVSGAALNVPPGGASIAGWQVTGAPVSVTLTPYNEGFETLLAGSGAQAVGLTADAFGGLGGIGQTVATTPGKDYVLTFQLGVYPGSVIYHGPIRVRVAAGAATAEFQHDATGAGAGCVWQAFALPFRATTEATMIQFQNLEAAGWAGLDRVAIAAVNPVSNSTPPPVCSMVSSTVAGGGGVSVGGRFSISSSIGQPAAGVLEQGGKHLFGGFWGPGVSPRMALEGSNVRVTWDFGLGFSQLETTAGLHADPGLDVWTPVSLSGGERSVLFPATGPMRLFRVREN